MADIEVSSSLRKHPRKITRLRNSMEKARKRIDELRRHLKIAESEYGRLEIEWNEYQASIAPIRTCPNEILSIIFHFYLLKNPHLVCRLLLVCKQWYAIAVHDPRMWNRIAVTIPDEWDMESAAPPIKCYIKCCLERSGTLLLDLDLDLTYLRSAEGQIIERISTCFIHEAAEDDWNEIDEWAQGLDVGGLLKSPTATRHLPKHMLEVVQQLVGDRGEIMARWGSVKLDFPESNMPFVVDIWQLFAWPAPNLRRMVIQCSEMMGDYGDELAIGFPEAPSLKHLDVLEVDTLDFLPLEHSHLETLVVHRGLRSLRSLRPSYFSQLQRLEIAGGNYGTDDLERFSVTLPKLCSLALRGDIENLDIVDFQVPTLQTLDLVRWGHWGFSPLPKLQSLHVRWKVEEGFGGGWSPAILLVEMERILVQYSLAVKLIVDELGRSAVIEAIRSLLVDGEWKGALETVVVKTPGGEEESFLVSSLC